MTTTQLLHMPAETFFDPLSHLSVPLPGEVEMIEELTKVLVIHKRYLIKTIIKNQDMSVDGYGIGSCYYLNSLSGFVDKLRFELNFIENRLNDLK